MSDAEELISIAARIRELAAAQPAARVYRHIGADGSEQVYSWEDIDRRSSQVAGELRRRGLGLGDRLALGLRNSPSYVFATFAAWKLGATPVPLRWDLPDWELARVREVVDAPVYLGPDDVSWLDATAADSLVELPEVMAPHVNGICSSGSTGTPKVILSERPGAWSPLMGTAMIEEWGGSVTRPQRILVLAPMYHTNGFSTLFSLLAGDHLTVLEKFDAARAVEAIERHRITTFTATPTMLKRLADLPGIERRDLSSIEWILQGAAPMPPYLVHRWADLVGAERLVMVYGMTEALGFTGLRGDEWMLHPGSVGHPIRETVVRILDDGGQDLPTGEIGQIYLRSALTIWGYRYMGDTPQLPRTEDGFRTAGDVGYLDADGYLYLVDRRVDLILSGGANVYPAEVEHALIDHPQIADVVVIGLPDPEWGQRVHAIVEPFPARDAPSAEDVRQYAKGRLAAYKVPKTVEIVPAIPRSEATKINRRALIEARLAATPAE